METLPRRKQCRGDQSKSTTDGRVLPSSSQKKRQDWCKLSGADIGQGPWDWHSQLQPNTNSSSCRFGTTLGPSPNLGSTPRTRCTSILPEGELCNYGCVSWVLIRWYNILRLTGTVKVKHLCTHLLELQLCTRTNHKRLEYWIFPPTAASLFLEDTRAGLGETQTRVLTGKNTYRSKGKTLETAETKWIVDENVGDSSYIKVWEQRIWGRKGYAFRVVFKGDEVLLKIQETQPVTKNDYFALHWIIIEDWQSSKWRVNYQ